MTDLRRMTAFRDVQLAEDFKKMAELGYLDHEFTVHGIVYWQNGTRNYVINSDEIVIWEQIKTLLLQNIYPSPIERLTKICHVPVGEEERIAMEVKITLAQNLKNNYSAEALQVITQEMQLVENQNLFSEIQAYCEDVEGYFLADTLQLARSLVELGYIHKNITEKQYRELSDWLKYEEKNIQEDIVRKDLIEKSFYTLIYRTQKGNRKLVTNARKDWIYNKTAELIQKGFVVAPFFSSTYWYHYQSMLDGVKEKHEEKAKRYLDDGYFEIIEKVFADRLERNTEKNNVLLEMEKILYNDKEQHMLQLYRAFMEG